MDPCQQQQDDEQARLWNGPAGRAWVDAQEVLDAMLAPFEHVLVKASAGRPAARVLDIGCGTGSTTLAIARQQGERADCTGVDLSEPMIALARARATREGSKARFLRADAQEHRFEAGRFDLLVSRFGVMFFVDPVRAFRNLRAAAAPSAELCFVAWRGAAENPFMTTAERSAAPLLPSLPARRAGGPGQFAFADPALVRSILEQSGWDQVDVRAIDEACALPEAALLPYLNRLGPLGLTLQAEPPDVQAAVVARVREAFEPYVQGTEVRFSAACWLISARAPA
ncbi:MAG: class I SAM-dependent methyltransferase [Myxococcales bacterium]